MLVKLPLVLLLVVGISFVLPSKAAEEPPYPGKWVPSGIAAKSPKPLPAYGSCTVGKKYTITSVMDLYGDAGELECMFAAGEPPLVPPLGFSYGYLLAAANTAFYDLFAEVFYQGDFTVKTQCSGEYYTIGWLSVAGIKPGTAIWSVGPSNTALGVDLAEGEYPLSNKNAIIMDFTQNLKELCHPQGNESPLGLLGFNPFMNSLWPMNQFIDLAVVVGRDAEDGGLISLNKAYILPKNPEDGAATILFYATKSFDDDVLPTFAVGDQIEVPPSPTGGETVDYYRGSVEALLSRLNPARIFGEYSEAYLNNKLNPSRSSGITGQQNTVSKVVTAPVTGLVDSLFNPVEGRQAGTPLNDSLMKTLADVGIDVEKFRDLVEGDDLTSIEGLVKRLEEAGIGVDKLQDVLKTNPSSPDHFTAALGRAGVDMERLVKALKVVDVSAGDVKQAREQMRSALESTLGHVVPQNPLEQTTKQA